MIFFLPFRCPDTTFDCWKSVVFKPVFFHSTNKTIQIVSMCKKRIPALLLTHLFPLPNSTARKRNTPPLGSESRAQRSLLS